MRVTGGGWTALALACAVGAPAAAVSGEKWDVTDPGVPREEVRFEATEGTWISVDVSPGGGLLAFDLLGDIYTLPAGGGEATLVSGGIPYEIQPRFSPDGSRILFTSDRGGGDNLWIMNVDGSDRRAVTDEDYRLLNNGDWHPSGRWVAAKKHFTSERSMGAGEMWLYKVPEGGEGVRLTERKNDQMDVNEPCFSPDGRFLYFAEDMSPGKTFQYNKDPNGTIYVIRRLELETGELRDLIRVPGGAARPQVSLDGETVAFVRRLRTRTVLCLFDLATGGLRELWDGLDPDQQETWCLYGVHPGFDWTPDGEAIVLSAGGKLWRVDAGTGERTAIPFRAQVSQSVASALRFPQAVGGDSFPVKVIRWPDVAPDGTAIFHALGTLWRQSSDGERPEALFAPGGDVRIAPAIAPGGRRIVYARWSDTEGGRVETCDLRGGGVRTVVDRPGHYTWARWSPDGERIVYVRDDGDTYRGRLWDEDPGIWITDADGGGQPRLLTRNGRRPRFSRDGERVFLILEEEKKTRLVSLNLLGSDRRDHAVSDHAADLLLSPDETWLAFEELGQVHVQPFPLHAGAVEVGPKAKGVRAKRVSRDGGTYLSWSEDSRTLRWSLGPELFSVRVDSLAMEMEAPRDGDDGDGDNDEDGDAAGDGSDDHAEEGSDEGSGDDAEEDSDDGGDDDDTLPPTSVRALGWDQPADVPDTDLWLVGATVLPMDDLSEIRDAVIHVRGNRIAGIGTRAEMPVPGGARTLDVTGKTVMPGIVDIHAHGGSSWDGLAPQRNWAFLARLAFGVTTSHDPSNDTQLIWGASELQRAGWLAAPRIFSTGTILYGAEGNYKTVIKDYDDALTALRNRAAWGAFTVKSYNQPRREQRQMVIKAGRELGIMVVPEGGSTLHHNLTHVLDGHTTIEHAIPVAPLYDPELRLLSRPEGTGITSTLTVGYGGIWGENWWYQHTQVWENERLAAFVPRFVLDPRSRRRVMAPEEEYHHVRLAETAAEIVRRGGRVQLGAHGQMQGIDVHWELGMFVQGGMSPHEALRTGTWRSARALGLDGDLGSLRAGKLADLIVLDADPRDDIRRSEDVAYTMVNGRLFDARTLEQLEPDRKPLPAGPDLDGVTEGAGHSCGPEAFGG
jgi:imidazolonepropionase-like amidohydrolase/Tol biopolymer transport system component